MPASTRIFVVALATSAQFPRLPDASMDTLTPMFASILALAVNSGVTFWLAQYLRAGSRLPASALRIRLCSSESRKPKALLLLQYVDRTHPLLNQLWPCSHRKLRPPQSVPMTALRIQMHLHRNFCPL